jgi:catechol 2,3-dioxygenase-like lactoylglutathione lyase family enzyme
VLGFEPTLFFEDQDDVIRGVELRSPSSPTAVALREVPERASAMRSYDPVAYMVSDEAAVNDWAARLDELGIDHTPVIRAMTGWMLMCRDPDGIEVRFYTEKSHTEYPPGSTIRPPGPPPVS